MSDLPPFDDDETPFESEPEKPKRSLILDDGELPFEFEVEKPKKRPPSRLWQKTYIPVPLLLAICALLVCSAMLLFSTSFNSGSLLCKLTSFCASLHNVVNQAAVNMDPRPPLDPSIAYSIGQADGKTVDVTLTPALYTQPHCDPAADYGNHLMFVSGWNSNAEIFLTTPSGMMVCRVTDNLISELSVNWSPDRQHILFVAQRDDNDINDVYTMNFDGSHVVDVSHDRFSEQRASWSADGSKIAFNYAINQQGRFSIMDADGSNRQEITPDTWNTYNASWSPDSTKVAFNNFVSDGTHEIRAVDLKTHAITLLASGKFGDEFRWSPNSASILILSSDNLARIDLATGEREALTSSMGVSTPIWSPEGTQVAFVSSGALQILNVATKEVRTLPISNLQDIRLVSWR